MLAFILASVIRIIMLITYFFFPSYFFFVALDARLEVGLEQQAELMLKMMSTLEADSILQALTNTSPTCKENDHF
jgi:uncharacterized protein YqfA (UPF0365 family)